MEGTVGIKVVNSLYEGLQKIIKQDWGLGGRSICQIVGRELLPDFYAVHGPVTQGQMDEHLLALARFLVEEQRLAREIVVTVRPEDSVALDVDQCVLLTADKRMLETYNQVMLCPLMNIMAGLVDETGIATERRTVTIEGAQCRAVFGLIGTLAMEAELQDATQERSK